MKHRYSSYMAIAIAAVVAAGCSAPKILARSDWQPQPITVDGSPDDWPQPLRYSNVDTKLAYSISNDNDKLYFCIMTTDRGIQTKIMFGGMQIRVDVPGKDDVPATLLYPIPGRIAFPKKPDPKSTGSPTPIDRQKLMAEANTLQVSGFPFSVDASELPLINKYAVSMKVDLTASSSIGMPR